jgi:undecaprenyl-diphosphatase
MRDFVTPIQATSGATAPSEPSRHTDEAAGDQRPTAADPFDAVRDARRVVLTFLVGLSVMIATLTAAGLLITETESLRGVRDWDSAISTNLADSRSTEATDLALLITRAGDTVSILALMSAVTLVLAVTRKWRAMILVPIAMLAEITTFLAVNHLVGRERPPVDKIGPLPGTYSFPSGHVAATLVCWVGISLLLAAYGFGRSARMVAALGALMAVAMAWARVYAGMHYTIDVFFGLVMGLAALALALICTGQISRVVVGTPTIQ